ncbi:hypothetical protein DPMN_005877 [Dreissena polymorpha]|uniref:Uncharacterized protein n=1 Tax=Dreissena polymorpha TaxID=45954 RepID=A0A9D4MUE2_DREPO|nr:hypothetical protein DPMN_005877 [Dreissena polymorpha]
MMLLGSDLRRSKTPFLLLARCAAFMATPAVTSRRLDTRNGLPSALSVLSTAAPCSLHMATSCMFWGRPDPGAPRMSSTLVSSLSRCSRPSSGKSIVIATLSIHPLAYSMAWGPDHQVLGDSVSPSINSG